MHVSVYDIHGWVWLYTMGMGGCACGTGLCICAWVYSYHCAYVYHVDVADLLVLAVHLSWL